MRGDRAGCKAIGYEIDEQIVYVLCAFERPDDLKCLFLINYGYNNFNNLLIL